MLEITPISSNSGSAAVRLCRLCTAGENQDRAPGVVTRDRVDLTSVARNSGLGSQAAPTVDERIRELRAQIESGTYLTPDKIDYVVDRLQVELFGVLPHVA